MRKFCLRIALLAFALLSAQWAGAGPNCSQFCSRVLCPDADNVYCDDGSGPTACSTYGNCFPVEW
jgi:hypothetical protein